MSKSERRLQELCALKRELTPDEQRETMRLARRVRQNAANRRRYHSDPAYRADMIARKRAWAQRQAAERGTSKFRRYSPEEDAVLAPFVNQPVADWNAILKHLPGRPRAGVERRLCRLRQRAGTLGKIQPWHDLVQERLAA